MKKFVLGLILLLSGLVFAVLFISAKFFCDDTLTSEIKKIIHNKGCTVSIAVIKDNQQWVLNNKKAPLMSVFKYFIAVMVLDKIEKEKLSLNDLILINEEQVIKTTYSPMLSEYTEFPFEISISDLVEYMVSKSDNNATDILLEYAGGLSALQKYLDALGFNEIRISANEKMMEADIQNQYVNQSTPLDVIRLMKLVREDMILSKTSVDFLDEIMIRTVTGKDKLKAGLPKGTVLGHKTGMSSRKPDGVRIAENDAGFVILPSKDVYYIAVFVQESVMTDDKNTALISEISKLVYEYFLKQDKTI